MSWIDDPWMGFDTETTGVRALKDRLVTAALVLRIDGASYRSGVSAPDQVATWLTDPGVEIPEQATAVHGITTEQARRDGRPIEEVLHELAGSIVEHWLRGYPVVAFNAADARAAEKYARLARRCGLAANPRALSAALVRLRTGLGIPARLDLPPAELKAALPALSAAALSDVCLPGNPRPVAAADVEAMMEALV